MEDVKELRRYFLRLIIEIDGCQFPCKIRFVAGITHPTLTRDEHSRNMPDSNEDDRFHDKEGKKEYRNLAVQRPGYRKEQTDEQGRKEVFNNELQRRPEHNLPIPQLIHLFRIHEGEHLGNKTDKEQSTQHGLIDSRKLDEQENHH